MLLKNSSAGTSTNTREFGQIGQMNLVEPEKCFYDHPNNIHDELKEFGEELREKFDKYQAEDELDFKVWRK
jgi:hypothetical protein